MKRISRETLESLGERISTTWSVFVLMDYIARTGRMVEGCNSLTVECIWA